MVVLSKRIHYEKQGFCNLPNLVIEIENIETFTVIFQSTHVAVTAI